MIINKPYTYRGCVMDLCYTIATDECLGEDIYMLIVGYTIKLK